MKISLLQLNRANNWLVQLARQPMDLEMSIPISQALAVFEQQQKVINKGLIDKAAKMGFKLGETLEALPTWLDEDNKTAVPADLIETYNNETEKYLGECLVSLPIQKISKAQLLASKVKLPPEALLRLDWLFDLYGKTKADTAEPSLNGIHEKAASAAVKRLTSTTKKSAIPNG